MSKHRFINVSLNGLQVKRYEDLSFAADDWPFFIENLLATGFKVSLSPSADGSSINMSLTDKRGRSGLKGVSLGCWAETVGACALQLSIAHSYADENSLSWDDMKKHFDGEDVMDTEDFIQYLKWKDDQAKDTGG